MGARRGSPENTSCGSLTGWAAEGMAEGKVIPHARAQQYDAKIGLYLLQVRNEGDTEAQAYGHRCTLSSTPSRTHSRRKTDSTTSLPA